MRFTAVLLLSALATTSPAIGKARYQAYEARNSVFDGTGGTRTTKNGIDYWTNGTPPRKYQVIGIISDKRGTGRLAGDVVGSKSVAKAALQNGGQAVIVLDQKTRIIGYDTDSQASAYGNQAYGSSSTAAIERQMTRLAVIKYLD